MAKSKSLHQYSIRKIHYSKLSFDDDDALHIANIFMYAHTWGEKPKPNYKRKELAPLCDWTSDKTKIPRASRPLQNFETSMSASMATTLMGKKDPAVPVVSSMADWFATYGKAKEGFTCKI